MSNRRSVLRLIGMAPIAAPVVAKEAAASMGLMSGSGGAVMAAIGQYANVPIGYPIQPMQDEASSIKDALLRLDEDIEENRRGITAVYLDADIAALRSMSPSVARAIQVDRVVARERRQRKSWLERRLKQLTGGLL